MQKKFLLFDVDHTLLDFAASEKKSLAKTFAAYALPFTEEVYRYYQVQNAKLWQDYEQGRIDRDTVLHSRFSTVFTHFGYDADGAAFEDSYRQALDHACDLMPDAIEVVSALSRTHELYVMTNGVVSTQQTRLRESGLAPYFKDVFISELIGFQKPRKEYFDRCFARIPAFDPAQALLIGDSLTSDMLGGNRAGVATCWFNPNGLENHTEARVDYEIKALRELLTLLA